MNYSNQQQAYRLLFNGDKIMSLSSNIVIGLANKSQDGMALSAIVEKYDDWVLYTGR